MYLWHFVACHLGGGGVVLVCAVAQVLQQGLSLLEGPVDGVLKSKVCML